MGLQIGIIGLPNVGKSTLFNVLTSTQIAEVANYPFCTIEPNQALVPVPDSRLDILAELVDVSEKIPAVIEFMDIAGLVKGASKGEGLGNKFLGQIRNTDALLHVVRCFDDPNVVHVSPQPDPLADIQVLQLELILSDLEQIQNKISRMERQIKGDPALGPALSTAREIQSHLESGAMLARYANRDNKVFQELNHELRFLTAKPVIYAANIGEQYLEVTHPDLETINRIASAEGAEWVQISAQLEFELSQLPADEQRDYLEFSGINTTGLEQIIQTGYKTLNLISFFTYNDQEARAWTLERGQTAPEAAGRIHTDFERGFIKAEVVPFADFQHFGSSAAARDAGKLKIQGKEYQVQDGDVILFRFNV